VKRVLLDENVAHALRKHLSNHETETAAYAGFAGLKNGELLKAAVESGFDVLVTADKTLQYEQNLSGNKHRRGLVVREWMADHRAIRRKNRCCC
jgi:hypothetical protein